MKPENPVEPFKRAVTAAVRAIARDNELPVNFGAEGTATGAGRNRLPTPSRELGQEEVAHVRGSGDALALWHRHHDNRLHALNQPKGATARAVFEAAEQARVESIGSKRMIGVSDNLDAMLEERCRARGYASVKDPGEALLPEVVALLVRERLTGKDPPAAAKPMVEFIRPWVEEKAGDDLKNLTGNITDQNAFAKMTRKLIADLDLGDEDGTESDDLEDSPDNEEEEMAEGEGEGGEGESAGQAALTGQEKATEPSDAILAAVGSGAPSWPRESGLPVAEDGFIRVGPTQQVEGLPQILAAGDVARRTDVRVRHSGVHAVYAGPVLATNLRRLIAGRSDLATYSPFGKDFYLFNTCRGTSILSYGAFGLKARWLRRLKDWLDRRWIARFSGR